MRLRYRRQSRVLQTTTRLGGLRKPLQVVGLDEACNGPIRLESFLATQLPQWSEESGEDR